MTKNIEKYIDETVKKAAIEFKRQGLLKDYRHSPFQKTEILLYNYNNFKAAIADKYEQIEEIKQEGIRKKSSSITSYVSSSSYDIKSDKEKADEKIRTLEESIQVTKSFIKVIDSLIDTLRSDPYFDLIPMRYFEGMNREEIAAHFNVDVSTISRNKNRLINQLQIRLFTDEVIYQILN